MNALTELQMASGLLSALMGEDSRLLLVRAVAWLDPNTLVRGQDRHDMDFDYDEEDELTVGLHVCRECFPTVYAGAIQLQWQYAEERVIKRFILEGINSGLVVPMQNLDELRYGPPVSFCGLTLQVMEPEDEDNAPWDRLLPVFALFGLSSDNEDGSDVAFAAVKALMASLADRQEDFYCNLVNLLYWMFACSGNTAVDYTQEEFWENGYDLPSWVPDDVALINEINQEAHEVISSAIRALDTLDANPMLLRVFIRNIKAMSKGVHKLWKGKPNVRHITFSDDDATSLSRSAYWPDCP